LVPLPGSIDADQKNNALVVEAAGGGWIAEQATLSPPSLATRLASLFSEPEALQRAAAAAKSLGQPQAVEKLADVAERLAVRGKYSNETAAQYRSGALRRHRRHRDERHRRNPAQPGLQGPGLGQRREPECPAPEEDGHRGGHRPVRRQSPRCGGGGYFFS